MRRTLTLFFLIALSVAHASDLDKLRDNFKKSWTSKTNNFSPSKTLSNMKSCGKDYENYLKSFGGLTDGFDKLKNDVKKEALGLLTGMVTNEIGALFGGATSGQLIETPYLSKVSSMCYENEKGGAVEQPSFGMNFDVCAALDNFNLCNCLPDLSFLGLKKRTSPPLKNHTSLKSLCAKAKNVLKEKDMFGKELAVKLCYPENSKRCQKILNQKPRPNAINTTDVVSNLDISSADTPDKYKFAEPMDSQNEKKFDILTTDGTDLDTDLISEADSSVPKVIIEAYNDNDAKTIESVKMIKRVLRNSGNADEEVNYNDVSVPYENIESYESSIIDAVHGTDKKVGELEDYVVNDPYERALANKLTVQQLVEEEDTKKASAKVISLVQKYQKDLIRFTKDRIQRAMLLTQDPETYISFPTKQTFEGLSTKEKLHRFYDISRQKLRAQELHIKYENEARVMVNTFKILLESYVLEAKYKKPSTAYMEVELELEAKIQEKKDAKSKQSKTTK